MSMDIAESLDPEIPEGSNFLLGVLGLSEACRLATDKEINGEVEFTIVFNNIGTVLSLLDRLASCFWGCQKGDHVVEAMVARSCSSAVGAMILLRGGYYDQALNISRSIGETANLLLLLATDKDAASRWRSGDRRLWKNEFGPVKIRLMLEKLGVPTPIGQEIYASLSQQAVHVTPEIRPQVYNEEGKGSTGAVFQRRGLEICINHIALALGTVAIPSIELIPLEKSSRDYIERAAHRLLFSIFGKSPEDS